MAIDVTVCAMARVLQGFSRPTPGGHRERAQASAQADSGSMASPSERPSGVSS
jgi:hypothetical protein